MSNEQKLREALQLKRIHPLDVPLEVFLADLSTKPRNVIRAEMTNFERFEYEDIRPPFTVRHLVMFSRRELKKWPGLGRKGLNEIEELLRARGLQLWEAHDERSLKLLREHSSYFPATKPQAQAQELPDERTAFEALRIFIGCAVPVDKSIDDRGHTWCEAYLDRALQTARAALAAKPVPDAVREDAERRLMRFCLCAMSHKDSTQSAN